MRNTIAKLKEILLTVQTIHVAISLCVHKLLMNHSEGGNVRLIIDILLSLTMHSPLNTDSSLEGIACVYL